MFVGACFNCVVFWRFVWCLQVERKDGEGEDRGKELGRERFFFFKGITTLIRAHPLIPPNPPPKTIILVGETQNMNLKPLKHSVYNVNHEKEIVISCVPSFFKHYCFVKSSQETYYVR